MKKLILITSGLLMSWLLPAGCTFKPIIQNTQAMQQDSLQFPTMFGDLLSGDKVTLPDYFRESLSIITVVYEVDGEYMQGQIQSTQWQNFWSEELKNDGIGFYEIPMIRKAYQWMSFLTDRSMRAGIPKNFHDNVITVYGYKESFETHFDIEETRDCFLCLVDQNGKVLFSCSGSPTDEDKERLEAVISRYGN